MQKQLLIFSTLVLTAFGSFTASAEEEFIFDTKGVDMTNYYQDLKDCKAFGEKQSVAGDAMSGAVTSALLGAATGAIAGDSSDWASAGAKWGAVEGLAQGAYEGYEKKRDIVRSCLLGRGYKVLN